MEFLSSHRVFEVKSDQGMISWGQIRCKGSTGYDPQKAKRPTNERRKQTKAQPWKDIGEDRQDSYSKPEKPCLIHLPVPS